MNVYNPKCTLSEREFMHYFQQLSINYVILGDFNAHHPSWEPSRTSANVSGNIIEKIITDLNNNIALATPPDLPTHTNITNGKTSTIDLIFCPPRYLPHINSLTLGDIGSDHTPIMSVLQFKPDLLDRNKRPKWILGEEQWIKWYEEVSMRTILFSDIIEDEIKNFTDTLITAATVAFKKNKK